MSQQLFDALSDPTRRGIIELLASSGQMSATDIYDNFSMSKPAVSQHLKVLRDAALVEIKKSAQRHLYSLNTKTMDRLQNWIRETTDLWNERFERLDTVLEAAQRKTGRRR